MRYTFIGCCLIGLFSWLCLGCGQQEEDVVARVYDKVLTVEDLQNMIPVFDENIDSVVVRQQYIDAWIARQALLHEAESYLSRKETQFDEEVENYRQSLLIYAYENKRVGELLDKNVTDEQIQQYYEKNKPNFKLRQPIVKINYLKFPVETPKINEAKALLFKYNRTEQDLQKLKNISLEKATNLYLSDDWLLYDDILKEIPLETKRQYPEQNQTFEFSDSVYVYLVKIIDFKINEGYSPVNIERENIVKSILQLRRMEIVTSLRRQALDKVKTSGELLVD